MFKVSKHHKQETSQKKGKKVLNYSKQPHFIILYVAFLTTFGVQDKVSARAIQTANASKIGTTIIIAGSQLLSDDVQSRQPTENPANHSNLASQYLSEIPQKISHEQNESDKLATISLDSLIGENSQNANQSQQTISPALKIVQKVSFLFFLLLFVPLGIFYPFFLFYKKLLELLEFDSGYQNLFPTAGNYKPSFPPSSPEETAFKKKSAQTTPEKKADQGTISKLQIAFSPQARRLKHQLAEISSGIDTENDYRITELMRQTIAALITQPCWTHISNSSHSCPVKNIKQEFDAIYCAEKDKCISRGLGLYKNHQQKFVDSDNSVYQDFYNYIVVTLIFSTTNKSLLPEQIHTKEQLIEELIELSKIQEDYLIDFEVLCNPQREGDYINNDQLLLDYGDMIRLF